MAASSKPARDRAVAALVDALRDYLRANMAPGAFRPETGPITFTVDAGDELDVTLTVKVSRRVARDQAAHYRNAALEFLATVWAGRRPRCSCHTKPTTSKGWGRSSGHRCEARLVAAVILDAHGGRQAADFSVQFVCGRHREKHGFRLDCVRGVVDLPASSVEGAFQRGRLRYMEKRRIILAQIAAGDTKLEAPPPSCRRCGTDRACNSCDFTDSDGDAGALSTTNERHSP